MDSTILSKLSMLIVRLPAYLLQTSSAARSLLIYLSNLIISVLIHAMPKAQGNLLLPSGQAGVGIRNCPDDYLLISGVRLCGERLNDGTKSSLMMDDAPISGRLQ